MPEFRWYGKPLYRFRDANGIIPEARIRGWENQSIEKTQARVREAALANMPPREFERLMREQIKAEAIRQYLLGHGGQEGLTPADYGSIGGVVADQYRYLGGLIAHMEAGDYSPQQVAALASMYINSTREAYERAKARVRGISALPAYPGDGGTKCLCITTPESLVLTEYGWVPLLDVTVGTLVYTHRERWRPVTALVVKPAGPQQQGVTLITPAGRSVGATANHLWWTTAGWQAATDIGNTDVSCYYTDISEDEHKTLLSNLSGPIEQSQPARPVCRLPGGMSFLPIPVWAERPKILFGGLLPPSTAVYDLAVAEDHSFCIEGLFAHNTNCKCYWDIHYHRKPTPHWSCYWRLGVAEHCGNCEDHAAEWSPYRITEKGEELE